MGLTKTYKDGSTPDIVIIGAGFSGLCAGIRLQTQLNIHSYRIFELEPDIGGTWWANTYPGCACDVKSHNYSFTFEPNYEWSKAYADQPEIWEYMRRVARKYNIYDKVRFQTEIKRVQWDDDRQKWILDYVDLKSGQAERTEADIVFSGTGPLRIPLIPKEFDNFTGPKWHTAQWDHSYDLTNKRVAVVGSGASAIQVVPSIVKKVKTLEYYQRTASYVIPRNNNPYNAVWRWMFRNIPLFHRVYHKILYWSSEALIFSFSTKLKARFPRALMSWLAWFFRFAQIRDKDLRKKLTPTYEIGCRRVVVSSDYYPALTRKNVNVHTEAIAGVKGNTLILKDGSVQEVDALVLATGFQVQNFLPRNFLIGKGGRDLMETWDNGVGPQTYYGLTAPETPNMFFLLGPHTALGHNSVLFMVETQVEYAIKAISYMMKNNLTSLQVKEDATNAFMDEMDRKMEGMVWSSACKSWYKNEAGKVTSLWWGSCSSYWRRLRNFHPARFTGVERV